VTASILKGMFFAVLVLGLPAVLAVLLWDYMLLQGVSKDQANFYCLLLYAVLFLGAAGGGVYHLTAGGSDLDDV